MLFPSTSGAHRKTEDYHELLALLLPLLYRLVADPNLATSPEGLHLQKLVLKIYFKSMMVGQGIGLFLASLRVCGGVAERVALDSAEAP